MTDTPIPPPPDPASASGKVADLEKQLADAAAQVAKVQAELSQARAADPNHPQVPVPYAGQAPVVMINGQVVSGGQPVDLSSILGAEGAAQVRTSLEQLGLGGQLGALFGGTQSAGPTPSALTQPGPAQRYSTTPGEIPSSGNKALAWLAAALVVGLIGVIVYLVLTT